jgi:hypothetical protein
MTSNSSLMTLIAGQSNGAPVVWETGEEGVARRQLQWLLSFADCGDPIRDPKTDAARSIMNHCCCCGLSNMQEPIHGCFRTSSSCWRAVCRRCCQCWDPLFSRIVRTVSYGGAIGPIVLFTFIPRCSICIHAYVYGQLSRQVAVPYNSALYGCYSRVLPPGPLLQVYSTAGCL